LSGKNSHTKTTLKPDFSRTLAASLSSILFILLSLSLIPYAGIQEDEALFSIPFFQPTAREFRIRVFHHAIPMMVMTYVGTLKTLIYWPLVHWFGSGVWAVRLPMALAGAVTVFVFYHLIRDSAGGRAGFAALVGALLLATDPVFVLTNTFDWGPVALEHLLLVTGCFLVFRFATSQSRIRDSEMPGQRSVPQQGVDNLDPSGAGLRPDGRSSLTPLALGFFCFGLALWNKALFVWALSGLTAGSITVFWPELRRCLTRRNAKFAAAGFLAGALPFVIYNVHHPNATLSENAHLDTDHLSEKWLHLKLAANGSSVFGYITGEADVPIKAPASLRGRVAEWVWFRLGERRESEHYYVYGLMLLMAPLWWRSRAARFSLVFVIVAWSMMALTKNAGAAAHHDVLLWPFPILFAVSVLALIPWRWVAITVAAAMLLMNLLVINQYILQFERDGAAGNYTDALFTLNRVLPEDQTIYVTDWGMNATLELTHQGRLRIQSAQAALTEADPGREQQEQLLRMLSDTNAIWLGHVTSREEFHGVNAHLEKFSTAAGFQRELIRTVADSNGRPVFEIFRFR
jgi:4-amino-4-deoxy-L-arabinose transferase-like glycosyltransferase